MEEDPIVAEVRRVREVWAASLGYDLDAMFRDLKEREARSGRAVVSFPPRRLPPRARSENAVAASTQR